MIHKTALNLLKKLFPFHSSPHAIYMFTTFRQKLFFGIYIFVILAIPVLAYLYSQQNIKTDTSKNKSQAIRSNYEPITKGPHSSTISKNFQGVPKIDVLGETTVALTPTPEPSRITPLFGPTLSFKVRFEERPKDNQSGRLFIGILAGEASINPRFLLSYTIDLPASGKFEGVSLAGLDVGSNYTAVLKGPAQIATATTFILSPANTNLNSGSEVILLSGDLNEDNVIDSRDLSIIQKSLGSTEKSLNWNENADFNKDGKINAFDAGVIIKNLHKTGDSGPWAFIDKKSTN